MHSDKINELIETIKNDKRKLYLWRNSYSNSPDDISEFCLEITAIANSLNINEKGYFFLGFPSDPISSSEFSSIDKYIKHDDQTLPTGQPVRVITYNKVPINQNEIISKFIKECRNYINKMPNLRINSGEYNNCDVIIIEIIGSGKRPYYLKVDTKMSYKYNCLKIIEGNIVQASPDDISFWTIKDKNLSTDSYIETGIYESKKPVSTSETKLYFKKLGYSCNENNVGWFFSLTNSADSIVHIKELRAQCKFTDTFSLYMQEQFNINKENLDKLINETKFNLKINPLMPEILKAKESYRIEGILSLDMINETLINFHLNEIQSNWFSGVFMIRISTPEGFWESTAVRF